MKHLIYSLLIGGLLISCSENAVDISIDALVNEIKLTQNEDGTKSNAELVYPVVYKMSDGTTFDVGKREELRTATADWYKSNPGTRERPSLEYPVEMTFRGGSYAVKNAAEMKMVREALQGNEVDLNDQRNKRIYTFLSKNGVKREQIESAMGALRRATAEAKGKGGEYQMGERLQIFFSETIGLTDEQIKNIEGLAIRMEKGETSSR